MPKPYIKKGQHPDGPIPKDPETTRYIRLLAGIRSRCYYQKSTGYERYGGRGIKISEDWKEDTRAFIAWAKKTHPKDGKKYSIERIDLDGDYSPENCRWATAKEQANNRSNNTFHKGKTLSQWADELGCKVSVITNRISRGWSIEDAVQTPTRKYKKGTR